MRIFEYLPLIGMVSRGGDPRGRPLVMRILDQSLIGIVAAAIMIYANDKVQDSKIEQQNIQFELLRQDIRQMREEIQEIRRLHMKPSILEGSMRA